ncbi:MAG: mannose-1-phosphate guanylyltransferase [Bacteroidales bacterium]|nr:MAG: mannose-1-phosphate guanylyltransferase [Bacteroidales bacterium]
MDSKDIYCVIMAGGIGSRFWPLSRTSKPKQFIDILGTGKTLLQQTFIRMNRICPAENIIIVTSQIYRDIVLEQLPGISEEQVILEPMRRNTAPCISFANYKIKQKNPNAIAIVAPSDHLILNEDKFVETINGAIEFAAKNEALLTLGIKPNRPETGYGYIQVGASADKNNSNLKKVKTFTEKPNLEMAKVFVDSGEFFWNSGLFIWSLSAISNAFEKHLPEVDALFKEISSQFGTANERISVESAYSECRNVSIDYGVMEKADNVYVICSEFGWSDLGTWGSLYAYSAKDSMQNAINGKNVMVYDSQNTIVNVPDNKLVILQGLNDYIVVESDDILLICRKQDEQDIKKFVSDVLMEKGEKYT